MVRVKKKKGPLYQYSYNQQEMHFALLLIVDSTPLFAMLPQTPRQLCLWSCLVSWLIFVASQVRRFMRLLGEKEILTLHRVPFSHRQVQRHRSCGRNCY